MPITKNKSIDFVSCYNFFFQKKLSSFSSLLIVLLITSACSPFTFSNIEDPNKKFIRNYKDQVGRINKERNALSKQQEKERRRTDPEYNRWRDSAYVIGVAGTITLQSAFIDTYKIRPPKPEEEFLPNVQTLITEKGNDRDIPDEVFTVSYSTENYPDSYRKAGVSFDDIKIPVRDAFGVETALGEKNFTLVSGRALQRNVDYTRTTLKAEDREIIGILVKEQKEIKHKKRFSKKDLRNAKEEDEEQENKENENSQNKTLEETKENDKNNSADNQPNITSSSQDKKSPS